MACKIPELSPRPLLLHELLALRTVWDDYLWETALAYVLNYVSTQEAIDMTWLLFADEIPHHLYKVDYLREFRVYPPSAFLAAFDLARLNRL